MTLKTVYHQKTPTVHEKQLPPRVSQREKALCALRTSSQEMLLVLLVLGSSRGASFADEEQTFDTLGVRAKENFLKKMPASKREDFWGRLDINERMPSEQELKSYEDGKHPFYEELDREERDWEAMPVHPTPSPTRPPTPKPKWPWGHRDGPPIVSGPHGHYSHGPPIVSGPHGHYKPGLKVGAALAGRATLPHRGSLRPHFNVCIVFSAYVQTHMRLYSVIAVSRKTKGVCCSFV